MFLDVSIKIQKVPNKNKQSKNYSALTFKLAYLFLHQKKQNLKSNYSRSITKVYKCTL